MASKIAIQVTVHRDSIWLDKNLFKRVKEIYTIRDELILNEEQLFLLEKKYKAFVRAGANLSEAAQTRLKEINSKLAQMGETFGQNVLAETTSYHLHVTNKTNLGNLPENLIALAADKALKYGKKEGWVFTMSRSSINPFLQYSPNRALRKEAFMAYAMRGNNDNNRDNKKILAEMASLRAERAKLKDYNSHAHYILSDNMAENPEAVYDLLEKIWGPSIEVARKERDAMQKMMDEDGGHGEIKAWDWRYYAEKIRKAKYDLDEEELRPYFEFTSVLNGAFQTAEKLFGITFHKLEAIPTWHEDQQVYEVKESSGIHVGLLYLDFFARESKRGGAWMTYMRPQSKLDQIVTPIVTNDFNFPPPTDHSPSLLSLTEASTLFHEFGHALHGLLSDVTYGSLSGTNTPRDFVEFPSQVMENWIAQPEVLRLFAKHYKTGESIPDELIDRIVVSSKFNQGFMTVEYLAASYLDMAWHNLRNEGIQDVTIFENREMERIGLMDEIIPRYRSTHFNHVFSNDPGYSAGYYSYLWSEVLDADYFQAFKDSDIFDKDVATRLRKILSKGGSKNGMELYKEYRGKSPAIGPLLERRGLKLNSGETKQIVSER